MAADGSQWIDDDWKFMIEWCIMAAVEMDAHYRNSTGENIKQLWDPPDMTTAILHTAPRMLLIPSNLIEFLTTIPRTPWELYSHIAGLVAVDGSQWTDDDWKFMVEWCIMATQVDPNHGSSWLAFEFDGGASGDPVFQQWCLDRLSLTLRVDKNQIVSSPSPAAQQANPPIDMSQMAQVMSAAVGQAVGAATAHLLRVREWERVIWVSRLLQSRVFAELLV